VAAADEEESEETNNELSSWVESAAVQGQSAADDDEVDMILAVMATSSKASRAIADNATDTRMLIVPPGWVIQLITQRGRCR
jgi:hypothetical protein